MCGIIGYLGDGEVASIIHEGLQNLEYRGYDSVGIALGNGDLTVEKCAGNVDTLDVPSEHEASYGIGHTRWSTHGRPTDVNAHPHVDCQGDVAVVHNGIIANHEALREELDGHRFVSDTDTEVIPHLLEDALNEGRSLPEAVDRVATRLDGSFAFCAIRRGDPRICATRRGSPLVIGHADGGGFIASDVPAFLGHTRDVTFLEDGAIVSIDPSGIEVISNGSRRVPTPETVDWDAESAEKGGYDHYMRKEIHEQPKALRQAISDRLDRQHGDVALGDWLSREKLRQYEAVHLVGAGTSHYAAEYGARLIDAFVDVRTAAPISSEYRIEEGMTPDSTLVIGVTQSGETKDTLDAVQRARAAGASTLAITNVMGSSVTRVADETVFLHAGPEIAVASTKAFSSQVTVLALVGIRLGRARTALTASKAREALDDIVAVPGAVQQALDAESEVISAAERFADAHAYFFIGRHFGMPVAYEGALKLKEISYAHAEAFPAGELKHGPLALVDDQTPLVAILTNGSAPDDTVHNVREAQTRDAPVIGITSGQKGGALDVRLPVPDVGFFEPIVANVYLQLFAYHTAKRLGRPIDKPRNLAKSVTVD